MKIKEFRQRFPEYGDLTDGELAKVASTMLSDLTDDEVSESQMVNAPEVTAAVQEVCCELEAANALLTTMGNSLKAIAGKKDKEEKDLSPHFMALGVQLANIEAAIKAIQFTEAPEPMDTEKPMQCKSFKIVRDEIGNIDSVVPQYEVA